MVSNNYELEKIKQELATKSDVFKLIMDILNDVKVAKYQKEIMVLFDELLTLYAKKRLIDRDIDATFERIKEVIDFAKKSQKKANTRKRKS